jgi:threonine aldolase
VFYDPSPLGVTLKEIDERARKLPSPLLLGGSRLVVHIQTSPAAVEDFLTVVRTLAEEKRAAGFVPVEKAVNGHVNGSIYKDIRVI